MGSYDVTINAEAFHETFLGPFYDAVKNGLGGTTHATNKVNGSYSIESLDFLGKYSKDELGFPWIVHADVSGQHSGINAANPSMDYESSPDWSENTFGVGLTNGSFTTARLDHMVIRKLMGYLHYGQDKGCLTKARGNYNMLSRMYAGNSIDLLKNTNNTLLLTDKTSISVFGSHTAPRYVSATHRSLSTTALD
jgi:beta-glucosidase